MTAILDKITGSESTASFDSLNPANGDVVGTYPIHSAEEVGAAVARARGEVAWWQGLGFEGRALLLQQWKGVITRRMAQLAELVHRETGKPHGDAQLEIALAIDHLDWASKHAKKVLGRHKVSSGLLMANQASSVAYHPLGVIGVIGPWNYPVFTPMGSIVYALAAGNTVVYKPSEYTPGVGRWLADTFSEVLHGRPVFQVVTGLGDTGNALCLSDIDKLAFTGSGATGRKVMAACATRLTPVIIEAGGKDSMIVDEDADVAAAAESALWGGLSNAGQTCVGIERVYVHEKVFEPFMSELTSRAQSLRAGYEDGSDIGPITMPSQIDIIKSHLDDAVEKGATVVLGGPDAVGERFVQPTILTHVPEDSTEITEETFGPTLAVNPVRSTANFDVPTDRARNVRSDNSKWFKTDPYFNPPKKPTNKKDWQTVLGELTSSQRLTKVYQIDLNSAAITDADIDRLKGLLYIRKVDLSNTNITNNGIKNIAELKGIRELFLYGTKVTDAGLSHLEGLEQLELVDLRATGVTTVGVNRLKLASPGIIIWVNKEIQ